MDKYVPGQGYVSGAWGWLVKPGSARGERGVTLIEVLFALLLLSFGLLAIAPLFAGSVKTGPHPTSSGDPTRSPGRSSRS